MIVGMNMDNSSPITNKFAFSQQQIDHLSTLYRINQIDENLKVISSVKVITIAERLPPRVLLVLEIYFYNKKIDTLSFDLHNYEYADIVHIAQNVRSNEFLLQEIDNFLAGDIVE